MKGGKSINAEGHRGGSLAGRTSRRRPQGKINFRVKQLVPLCHCEAVGCAEAISYLIKYANINSKVL
jgi:hypothetical protein